jgi:hypothetical protein
MRDESRPTDAFAWTRPWVPYGDDPFRLVRPGRRPEARPAPANDAREAPRAAAEARSSRPPCRVAAPRAESGDDIWVDFPRRGTSPSAAVVAVAVAADRTRQPSRKRRWKPSPPRQAASEPVVEQVQPEPANDAPPAKKPRASRAKAKPAVVEPVVGNGRSRGRRSRTGTRPAARAPRAGSGRHLGDTRARPLAKAGGGADDALGFDRAGGRLESSEWSPLPGRFPASCSPRRSASASCCSRWRPRRQEGPVADPRHRDRGDPQEDSAPIFQAAGFDASPCRSSWSAARTCTRSPARASWRSTPA